MKKFTLLTAIALTLSFLGTASSFAKEGKSLATSNKRSTTKTATQAAPQGDSTANVQTRGSTETSETVSATKGKALTNNKRTIKK